MDDPLWHQAVRDGNYEPLESDEAKAVANAATALLSRAEASGALSLAAHRAAYTAIGYDISIKGWDVKPPEPLAELGGLTISQLAAVIQRALQSGTRYQRSSTTVPRAKPVTDKPSTDATLAALERIRRRMEDKRNKEQDPDAGS